MTFYDCFKSGVKHIYEYKVKPPIFFVDSLVVNNNNPWTVKNTSHISVRSVKILDMSQRQTLWIVSEKLTSWLFLVWRAWERKFMGTKTVKLHLPSTVSTQSCRPKFCCGFITQWLLVAVMSKTSQPPSDAWTFLESSKNVSASLKVRKHNETINKPQLKWYTLKQPVQRREWQLLQWLLYLYPVKVIWIFSLCGF